MLAQIRPVIPDAPIGEAARGQRPISGARLSGIGLVAATRNFEAEALCVRARAVVDAAS